MDEFSEVSSESWFGRLKSAIVGVLFGGLLFIAAFPVLYMNEGRAVRRAQALTEGAGATVAADASKVDSANEGKPVHLTGEATTEETLSDPQFPVQAKAIRLNREVEMFQWVENEKTESRKKLGGGKERITTYSYEKKWADHKVDSSGFKTPEGHQNPGPMPYEARSTSAKNVTLGAYELGDALAAKVSKSEAVPATQEMVDKLNGKPAAAKEGAKAEANPGDKAPKASDRDKPDDKEPKTVALASGSASAKERFKLSGGAIYIGENPAEPKIGDARVSFSAVMPAEVSVVAKQTGKSLGAYTTSNGGSILLLKYGKASAEEMFADAQAANAMLTWILRAVGFGMLFFGVMLMLSPLAVLADVVPFLGDLVGLGTAIAAFMVAAPLALITIALGWMVARPLIGAPLLVLGLGLIVWLFQMVSAKKAARVGDSPAEA